MQIVQKNIKTPTEKYISVKSNSNKYKQSQDGLNNMRMSN